MRVLRFTHWSTAFVILILSGCFSLPTDRGQQYLDGEFYLPFELVNKINAIGSPVNQHDFIKQIDQVKTVSPALYKKQSNIYQAINRWIKSGADLNKLKFFGLNSYQMAGADNYGNVHFTGYYTPVMHARYEADSEFRYPLYRMPTMDSPVLPTRGEIYAGALSGEGLELAYSRSIVDNFVMAVQGSGYIDFNDGEPLAFFGYTGKNNHPYQSIGRILIERGEVPKRKMSMQAIKQWAEDHGDEATLELLSQNPSFVFYQPQGNVPVVGASGIPLIAKASVAADRDLIQPGTALLIEYPLLDDVGHFNGQHELRLVLALDVGGAIKGNHLDVYQGIGNEAGHAAGFYNHYGRVWMLSAPTGSSAASPVE